MKIFNLVSNIVIIIAFILLCIFHPKGKCDESVSFNEISECKSLPLAYVNIDSIIVNYQKAIDLNEELMKQQENARTDLMAKARELEADMAEFQRKVENNGFLTMERAQSEQQRLMDEQQKLEDMQNRFTNELVMKQQNINEQVTKSIMSYVAEYNADKKYEMIFTQNSSIGTILYAAPIYNITDPVLEALNKKYNKEK